ncbi:hypothetical protein D9M68_180240 [compost metagenome]|uniref:Uncharacterized protein n=1 Tax=Pseudomonas jinjuensis TaxID=198616 RepID=A0A1H0AFW9_9PSED|nr:DUF6685 family protein [Pseudomonas jinjuensis]SDN32419.1 hypothetical protein SAMN05216193_102218 [Pseudomonas jinjuensis]
MSQLSVTRRLASLAQRLGLKSGDLREIAERTQALSLAFSDPVAAAAGIGWQSGPPLHRLIDLPRGALSGPVQEDKAHAHATLTCLVEWQEENLPALDIRRIDGLCSRGPLGISSLPDLEALAASEACRKLRIISYRDFARVLGSAVPGFERNERLHLRQASWHGERLFRADENHPAEFSCAVVYARRRGLEISLPASVRRYRLNPAALDDLDRRYHMLAMPSRAWSDPAFMQLLLDTGLPYARLGLFNTETPESLLLPKDHPQAHAFGLGLRAIGASDLVACLRACESGA